MQAGGYAAYSKLRILALLQLIPPLEQKIRMHSAVTNGTHESFHIQFPHQIHRHALQALFHVLMVCVGKIVSRTLLHVLGIPNSLKLSFRARTPFWCLQDA